MANVPVTITHTAGTPGTWTATYAGPPYTNPLSETFSYTSTNSTDPNQCKLWYNTGMGTVSTLLTKNGSSFTVNSGITFAVTDANDGTTPALSHVIHVGSGKP